MSANNLVLIEKKGKTYKISYRDCEEMTRIGKIQKADSALTALRIANEMIDSVGYVEYGIVFREKE